jgi:signal transduction histidine kinase
MLCTMLGVMDFYFFGLLTPLGITSLYVVGVMCAGMLFLLPPRLFAALLLGHHALFCALLLSSDLGGDGPVRALVEGTVGVAISLLAAWLIYTARRNDFRHERTLAASNAALHERNAELNDLMAIAAHDLRSPLQGVQHLVDLAAQNPAMPAEKRQRALDEVRRTCRNLLGLIGRLLDAHNAETAPAGHRAIDADFTPVVAEAVRRAQPLAAPRGVRCELRTPPWADAVAHHDASSLQQALDNLVANAVKFAPDNGTVAIDVRAAGDRWRIEVEDDGPGIPPDERARLFQKFFRGSARPSGSKPSSGLGLFIVRKEVEAMGGTVHHEPRSPHGSVFVITLHGKGSS